MAARPAAPARFTGTPRMGAPRVGVVGNRIDTTIVTRPGTRVARSAVFVSNGRFHNAHFRGNRFFFHNCIGFPCRNRFFLSNAGLIYPFGYPFFDPFYSDLYSQPEPPQQVVSNDNGSNAQLAMEVQRLSDQVEELRNQQERQAPPPPQHAQITVIPPAESTAFIFRDGHRITAQNYAVVGDTLWVLSEHTAKKVSLANLDKAATEQANAANGIDLRLP
jgi:hypothetical protein